MEDFAGLIVFFLIIGLIEKFGKKSKMNRNTPNDAAKQPAGKAAPKKAAPPAREVALPIQAVKKAAEVEFGDIKDFRKAVEALKQPKAKPAAEKKPAEQPPVKPAAAPRPISFTDDQGCIGGSIAHTQHEGESKAEHAEHMKRSLSNTPAPTASAIRNLRAEDMRKAVILSEILDKPKALRH